MRLTRPSLVALAKVLTDTVVFSLDEEDIKIGEMLNN